MEKSLAPTGIRHSVKPGPTPGVNSSLRMLSRSSARSRDNARQPSSLKQTPKPSTTCRPRSARTMTSGIAVIGPNTGSPPGCHAPCWVVTVQEMERDAAEFISGPFG